MLIGDRVENAFIDSNPELREKKIRSQELRALAEGSGLKQWHRSEQN